MPTIGLGVLVRSPLRHPVDAEEPGGQRRGTGGPHGGGQQRVVDDDRLPGALTMEERGRDAPGDGEAADDVAEGRARLGYGVALVGVGDDVGRPAPPPEGAAVVPAAIGVGTELALTGSPDVDDVRVGGADVLHVDAQLPARLGPEIGEEHVRRSAQPQQQIPALIGAQVETDAALASVGQLHHVGHAPRTGRHQPRGGQAPLRIAGFGVLDLDDVGAPLGQNRAGHRDVRPRGHLHHPDAVHDSHRPLLPRPCPVCRVPVLPPAARRAALREPSRSTGHTRRSMRHPGDRARRPMLADGSGPVKTPRDPVPSGRARACRAPAAAGTLRGWWWLRPTTEAQRDRFERGRTLVKAVRPMPRRSSHA